MASMASMANLWVHSFLWDKNGSCRCIWSVRESTLVSQWLNDKNTEDAATKATRTNLLSESVLAINSLAQDVGIVFILFQCMRRSPLQSNR